VCCLLFPLSFQFVVKHLQIPELLSRYRAFTALRTLFFRLYSFSRTIFQMALIVFTLFAIFLMKSAEALVPLANLVPQSLEKRSTASGGGWALSQGTCPPSSTACGSAWCCPNLLTCNHLGSSFNDNICCPGST
jgi:hypothetical protein